MDFSSIEIEELLYNIYWWMWSLSMIFVTFSLYRGRKKSQRKHSTSMSTLDRIELLSSLKWWTHTWNHISNNQKILVIIIFISIPLLWVIYLAHLAPWKHWRSYSLSQTQTPPKKKTNTNASDTIGFYSEKRNIASFDNFDEDDNGPLFS